MERFDRRGPWVFGAVMQWTALQFAERLVCFKEADVATIIAALEAIDDPVMAELAVAIRALDDGPSLVIDPFMGSGTTLRAAKDAGVKAIGIEISERYCEMAVARLAQEAFNFGAVA